MGYGPEWVSNSTTTKLPAGLAGDQGLTFVIVRAAVPSLFR